MATSPYGSIFDEEPFRDSDLLTGGSLGAQRLNDAFRARTAQLGDAGIQVLHVTGLGKEFEPDPSPSGASLPGSSGSWPSESPGRSGGRSSPAEDIGYQ